MTLRNKVGAGIAAATFGVLAMGGTASARHAHFVVIDNPATGETTCQYIGSGQTSIADPGHGGYHQIHENVHTGTPGKDGRGTTVDRDTNEEGYDCETVRQP